MSRQNFILSVFTINLSPQAHHIFDVLLLIFIFDIDCLIWVQALFPIKHAERNLKLELFLAKFLSAQAILNLKVVESSVLVLAQDYELVDEI